LGDSLGALVFRATVSPSPSSAKFSSLVKGSSPGAGQNPLKILFFPSDRRQPGWNTPCIYLHFTRRINGEAVLQYPSGGPPMEPQNPPFVVEPDPEEAIEATDYYEAMRMGWLSSDPDEVLEQDPTPVGPPAE
jgi:hypothetical protein